MTPAIWAAIGSWAAVAASLFTAAFVYGKLTQKVSDVKDDIIDLKGDVREVRATQKGHGEEIVRIKERLKLHD